MTSQNITNCLWFEREAEMAVEFYTGIFPNSEISSIQRFGKEGFEHHGMPEGAAMAISFQLNGQPLLAHNGRPASIQFSDALSLVITCVDQTEIDHYWNSLVKDGKASMCGWLKDQFGVSWQIVPKNLNQYLSHPNPEIASQLRQAMFGMQKIDLNTLKAISTNA